MENDFFPLFINLKNKNCLVVGGGEIAYRKIKILLKYGAKVNIITESLKNKKILALNLDIEIRDYKIGDIDNYFLVIAATNNKELNKNIYIEADSKGILVNNTTTKTELNARFSAVLEKEKFTIAVSSKGKNPKQAVELRNKLEEIL